MNKNIIHRLPGQDMVAKLVALVSIGFMAAPAAAFDCPSENVSYVQDRIMATGWNQILPVDDRNAGTVRFGDFGGTDSLQLTINGETRLYGTIGGGTGIMARAAVSSTDEEDSHWFIFYDVKGHSDPDQPDHFMIFDGDLYWPQCD